MTTFYFSVIDKYLKCTNSRKIIVGDQQESDKAHFTFNDSWDLREKSISFTNTKTGVSVGGILLDLDNNCTIPYEPLADDGELVACVKGVNGDEIVYTRMDLPIKIVDSDKTDASTPAPPSQDVYDQILELASDKYVNAISEDVTIEVSDWLEESNIIPITFLTAPIIIEGQNVVLRTGTFSEYLDETIHPYDTFYIGYSTDGINQTSVVANSQTLITPSQRKIIFIVGGNEYELKITATELSIKRTSGTTDYYIHAILLEFASYYYYNIEIAEFTTKWQAYLFLDTTSREAVKGISFNRYPQTSDGYVQLIFSSKPTDSIKVLFRALRTDKDLIYAEWLNTYSDIIFREVLEDSISDLTTEYDNYIPTVGQIKEYVNSKLI